MFDNAGFRVLSIIVGLVFLGIGTCGALDKASDEGWNGPSSKPGAASKPAPKKR